jgi:hypothetical protein
LNIKVRCGHVIKLHGRITQFFFINEKKKTDDPLILTVPELDEQGYIRKNKKKKTRQEKERMKNVRITQLKRCVFSSTF